MKLQCKHCSQQWDSSDKCPTLLCETNFGAWAESNHRPLTGQYGIPACHGQWLFFSHMLDHIEDNFRLIRFFGSLMWYGGSPNSQILIYSFVQSSQYMRELCYSRNLQYNTISVTLMSLYRFCQA